METSIKLGVKSTALKTKEIKYLIADINYTNLVFKDGTKQLVCYTLRYIESLLPKEEFLRINRSTVVNKAMVANYAIKESGDLITMEDATCIQVSRRRKVATRKLMKVNRKSLRQAG